MRGVLAGIEVDADGNPLHYLDVIAGRVLRREQAEAFARSGCYAGSEPAKELAQFHGSYGCCKRG
jgi:hypothetical protein